MTARTASRRCTMRARRRSRRTRKPAWCSACPRKPSSWAAWTGSCRSTGFLRRYWESDAMTIRVAQDCWLENEGWRHHETALAGDRAGLVLVFGASALLRDEALFRDIRTRYPHALVLGCSTAGEI